MFSRGSEFSRLIMLYKKAFPFNSAFATFNLIECLLAPLLHEKEGGVPGQVPGQFIPLVCPPLISLISPSIESLKPGNKKAQKLHRVIFS